MMGKPAWCISRLALKMTLKVPCTTYICLAHVCGAVYMCMCNAMHENLMVFGFKTDAT